MCAIQTFEQYEAAHAKIVAMFNKGTLSATQFYELERELYKQLKTQLFV